MGRQSYTREELYHLRSSPLVQWPDDLQSAQKWIDIMAEPALISQRKTPKTQNARPADDSEPMGNFGSQRPTLTQTRHSRVSGGDDLVLGPPKTTFGSSRNFRKTEDDILGGDEGEDFSLEAISARTRNYNEDDGARRRGFGMEDKDKDGWTTARRGKGHDPRQGEREKGFGRGARGERFMSSGDDAGRRNGYGAREDIRWSRDGEERRPPRLVSRETASWRDRDPRPERQTYGREALVEKEPEWMDEPMMDEGPVARTAAEFEQWKARMKGQRSDGVQETDQSAADAPKPSIFADPSFGTWGDTAKPEPSSRPEQTPTTPATNKKASRFASMFAPKEAPAAQELLPGLGGGAPSADQEAFQRMLSKLRVNSSDGQGGVSLSGPPGMEQRSTPNPLIQSILSGKPDSRPPHSREQSSQYPPGRDFSTPESERKTPTLSKDSEFLLNLIQKKPASRPQNGPDQPFPPPPFIDQPRAQTQGPPRDHPSSGPLQSPREHAFSPARPGNENDRRAATQPPPGFFDGPGGPQGPPPGFGPMGPGGPHPPPDFFRHDGPPPPGFMGMPPPHMHHGPPPPGFGLPPPHMLQPGQQPQRPPGVPENPYGNPQMPPPPGFQPGFMLQGFNGPPPPGQQAQGGGQGPPGMMRVPLQTAASAGRGTRPR